MNVLDTRHLKKSLSLLLMVAFALIGTAACSTVDRTPQAIDNARMQNEAMTSWTRPVEISYEFVGDVEGSSEFTRIFGITTGEAPRGGGGRLAELSTLLLGTITGDQARAPYVNLAAANAISTIDADGIYVTSVEVTTTGLGFLFYTQTTRVKGKAIRIVDLGVVDQDRADNMRYIRALPPGVTLPNTQNWLPKGDNGDSADQPQPRRQDGPATAPDQPSQPTESE